MHDYDKLFIGGQWVDPATSATIPTVRPTFRHKFFASKRDGSIATFTRYP
mgnify:CR=1 FL=1